MATAEETCESCGGRSVGLVCPYCGLLKQNSTSFAEQEKALQELHTIIRQAAEKDRAEIIRNGFIPDHKSLLVDAGLMMVTTLNVGSVAHRVDEAAAGRLKAVLMKLRLLQEDTTAEVAELEQELARFEKQSKDDLTLGLTLFGGCGLVLLIIFVMVLLVGLYVALH